MKVAPAVKSRIILRVKAASENALAWKLFLIMITVYFGILMEVFLNLEL